MSGTCTWAKCTRVGVCKVYLKILGRQFCASHCALHRESMGIEDLCEFCNGDFQTTPVVGDVDRPIRSDLTLQQPRRPAGQHPSYAVDEPYASNPDTGTRWLTPAAQPAQYVFPQASVQHYYPSARRTEQQHDYAKATEKWPQQPEHVTERPSRNQKGSADELQYPAARDFRTLDAPDTQGAAGRQPRGWGVPGREPGQKQPPSSAHRDASRLPPPILKSLAVQPVPKPILKPPRKLEFQPSRTDTSAEKWATQRSVAPPAPINPVPPQSRGERPWNQYGSEGQRRPRERPYSLRTQPPFSTRPGAPHVRPPPTYSDSEDSTSEDDKFSTTAPEPAWQPQEHDLPEPQLARKPQPQRGRQLRFEEPVKQIQPRGRKGPTTYFPAADQPSLWDPQRRKAKPAFPDPVPGPSSPASAKQLSDGKSPRRRGELALQPLDPVISTTTEIKPLKPVANRHASPVVDRGHSLPTTSPERTHNPKAKRQKEVSVIPKKKPSAPKPRRNVNEHRTLRPRPTKQQNATEPVAPAKFPISGGGHSEPRLGRESASDSESATDPTRIPLSEGESTDDSSSVSDDTAKTGKQASQQEEIIVRYRFLEDLESAALRNVYLDSVPIPEVYRELVDNLPAYCIDNGQEDGEPDIDVFGNPRPPPERSSSHIPDAPLEPVPEPEPEPVLDCSKEPLPKPQHSPDFEEFPCEEHQRPPVGEDLAADLNPAFVEYDGGTYDEEEYFEDAEQEAYGEDATYSPERDPHESDEAPSDSSSAEPSQPYLDGSSDPIDELLSLWETASLPDHSVAQTFENDHDSIPWHTSGGSDVAKTEPSFTDDADPQPQRTPASEAVGASATAEIYISETCYTKNRKNFYAVHAGKRAGIYGTFPEMQEQTLGVSRARITKYRNLDEAKASFDDWETKGLYRSPPKKEGEP
ncbi:hypothetical protein BZA05DRAFT_407774 [Tricharina praecox]|uniref:uncharacterized protein n=1 Tax=Tricharina praecox TaxID=43433 RepID=UPI0022201901|nr:uncharacterized protein BZA05DRAFT_407774 [Tricharina praecox]KAI5845460.1 hypothetical protein BZA05DRAFT_407774 [Tricharina praecox]